MSKPWLVPPSPLPRDKQIFLEASRLRSIRDYALERIVPPGPERERRRARINQRLQELKREWLELQQQS
jgi:hypothetical protein